jgi:hypothetical protein
MFERTTKPPLGTIWAKSINKLEPNGTLWVSVVNITDKPVKIKKNALVGTINGVEESELLEANELREICDEQEEESAEQKLNKLKYGELNDVQREQIKSLLRKYIGVFNWNDVRGNSTTPLTKHAIDVGNNKPFKMKQYRVPHNLKQEMENQVKSMLEKNVIRPSQSPWNSPVILVKKKNGKFRFCVDFRKLNEITIKDSYPLPFIDETVDAVAGSMFFHHIRLCEWLLAR